MNTPGLLRLPTVKYIAAQPAYQGLNWATRHICRALPTFAKWPNHGVSVLFTLPRQSQNTSHSSSHHTRHGLSPS
jgi:hypothetical protein